MEDSSFAESQQSSPTPMESPAATERMIPESKVNEMVRHSNARVAEKARKEVEERLKTQYAAPTQSSTPAAPVSAPSIDEFRASVVNDVLQKFQEHATTQAGNKIAQEFYGKLAAAKDEFPEIDQIYNMPLANMSNSVRFANEMDNTAAIMMELRKNPGLIAQIESLAQIDPSGSMARDRLKQLSESIRINEEAKNAKTANPPLSQIQPSPIGLNNGSTSLKDLKRLYRG